MINNLCGEEKLLAEKQHKNVYDLIEQAVDAAGQSGIIFCPYIFGNAMNSGASAGFYGIKNWHTKADILRAVYEGIVMGHYGYVRMMPKNENFKSVWLIGGGAKSKILGQMFADMTGLPVKIAASSEITARGGAMNAMVGLGIYKDHIEGCIPLEIHKIFMPNPKANTYYMKKFLIFNEIGNTNTEIMNNLDEFNRKGK
jgi:L-xylulokinase